MTRRIVLVCLGVMLGVVSSASAQAERNATQASREFVASKPTLGDHLPDLTVYDESGRELELSSLRGHYTVLTFGCLT